jgi:anti-sigma regulatory factor (Ser/Thr protein kinase)
MGFKMTHTRTRGQEIHQFILENVEKHKHDVVAITASKFAISRPAVLKHIRTLIEKNILKVSGVTKNREYALVSLVTFQEDYQITPGVEEDVVWREDILPVIKDHLSVNAVNLWQHAFTEMFNNAIDHSGGTRIIVQIFINAINMDMAIIDNGEEGIFKKIQRIMGLHDERHAILELAKGKLTTDPTRHSGEGIFFSSRMVDRFAILSGGVYFSHNHDDDSDWVLENDKDESGTCVILKLRNNTTREARAIFDQYAPEEDNYGFTKTVVPVRLAQYGDELLVSRSQAKRLLARFDRFRTVLLDFTGVSSIGQAFADEIFRVFMAAHTEVEIIPINMSASVSSMVTHVMTS